ncbi:MAG: porin family protein [Sulfurimonas sp.]|nr:porin family protein [Sulfurimonas sp.]
MKKILLMAMLLTSLVNAEQIIKIGASQNTVINESATGISIGWGAEAITKKNILLGVNFNFDYASDLGGKSFTAYYGDIKVGYAFLNKKLGIYALGSAMQQTVSSENGYGFGYGAGVSYRLLESVSIAAQYKTYSMTNEATDYDYDSLTASLQYHF